MEQKKYYMLMNEDRTVFGLKLKEGLNEWTEPAASASYSGFSFVEEKDLFNLIHCYDCIAEVDVPDGEKLTLQRLKSLGSNILTYFSKYSKALRTNKFLLDFYYQ